MTSASLTPAAARVQQDAVTATALTVVRRALIENVPVTLDGLEREASVALGAPPEEAMRAVDEVAQRLGVSSLA